MFYSLDRIEENKAILIADNAEIILVDIALLPYGFKEGDVFLKEQQTFLLNEAETYSRRAKNAARLKKLKKV